MGLSIARTIVEAHNGEISAKNRDHGGAAFRIKLPISSDSSTQS
nr:ATP-binding protein [Bradyrhizobium sp. CCBAU 051011]